MDLKAAIPDLEDPISTAIERMMTDPTSGKMTRHAPEHLAGRVYRSHVGGGPGHRLFYIFDAGKSLIVPVYVSEVPKKDFDYNAAPWRDFAEEFYDDYTNKRYDRFRNFEPD